MNSTKTSIGGALRAANSLLRFLLELASLAALGVWGFHASTLLTVQVLLAVAAPLAAAALWSVFIAPRARFVLHAALRSALEVLVFGSAALALIALDQPDEALVLASVAIVNMALLNYWGQWQTARAAMTVRSDATPSSTDRRRTA